MQFQFLPTIRTYVREVRFYSIFRWGCKYVVLDCSAEMAKEIVISHVRSVPLGKRTYHYLLSGLVSKMSSTHLSSHKRSRTVEKNMLYRHIRQHFKISRRKHIALIRTSPDLVKWLLIHVQVIGRSPKREHVYDIRIHRSGLVLDTDTYCGSLIIHNESSISTKSRRE